MFHLGDSYKSMAFLYRIPSTTLSQIIPETCAAIYKCLKDEYMKVCCIFCFTCSPILSRDILNKRQQNWYLWMLIQKLHYSKLHVNIMWSSVRLTIRLHRGALWSISLHSAYTAIRSSLIVKTAILRFIEYGLEFEFNHRLHAVVQLP